MAYLVVLLWEAVRKVIITTTLLVINKEKTNLLTRNFATNLIDFTWRGFHLETNIFGRLKSSKTMVSELDLLMMFIDITQC